MKMRFVLFMIAAVLPFVIISQEITVEFIKEGRQQKLNNNFKIYFLDGDSTYMTIVKPKINGNTFEMPPLQKEESNVLFEYKNRVYNMGNMNVVFSQKYKLVIGYDKKPISREYSQVLRSRGNIDGVFYVEFHPLESGCGTVKTLTFDDSREFLNRGKYLIYKW
jgi:hypothetical protein